MKVFMLCTLLMGGLICSASAQSNDFRGFIWGSSIEKVQADEKVNLIYKLKNDELEYEDKLAGSDCNVIYIFNDNNKLVSGNYFFTKKYSNPQLYIQDYNKFKELLAEKYGKPASEKETWSTHMPVTEKHNFGQAVADGNLSLNTVWTTERSQIKIALISSDKHPSLQIQYMSLSLDELESKEDMKKALGKL